MFYGQLVIGPAGSGKSSYCHLIQGMARLLKRTVHVVNLDPAAESFRYTTIVDIKDLVNCDDVMEMTNLGPNGGLVYSMEYLLDNMEWLQEELGNLGEDDYVLFDCPGQLELYTHLDIMSRLVKSLESLGFRLCSVCLMDSTFLSDEPKFFSGVLMYRST